MGSMHSFSIELKSKNYVKNLSIPDEGGKVIIEGNLGKIKSLKIVEDIMLEIEGDNGSICLDFDKKEIEKILLAKIIVPGV
jgi:hypothetical protein